MLVRLLSRCPAPARPTATLSPLVRKAPPPPAPPTRGGGRLAAPSTAPATHGRVPLTIACAGPAMRTCAPVPTRLARVPCGHPPRAEQAPRHGAIRCRHAQGSEHRDPLLTTGRGRGPGRPVDARLQKGWRGGWARWAASCKPWIVLALAGDASRPRTGVCVNIIAHVRPRATEAIWVGR